MNLRVFAIPAALTLLLPLLGILSTGRDITPFLAFPPKPVILSHPGFSFPVFIGIAVFALLAVLPFVQKGIAFKSDKQRPVRPLPLWGVAAGCCLVCFWMLAWTRFKWMTSLQPHTFFPLWISWIVLVNALAHWRSGQCPMLANPVRFIVLFLVSAVFWWGFEYLNRFVGNWHYTGSQYTALTYFILATVSFSTVLPAVESMKAFLLTCDLFQNGFKAMPLPGNLVSRTSALTILAVSCALLFFVGIFPAQLFPLIWVCPFCIFLACRILAGMPHSFSGIRNRDYTQVVAYASAAAVCGIFWELFNFYSLARWHYSIPYVQALHVFEMPILGYAGYLPFGLECALIIDLVMHPGQSRTS